MAEVDDAQCLETITPTLPGVHARTGNHGPVVTCRGWYLRSANKYLSHRPACAKRTKEGRNYGVRMWSTPFVSWKCVLSLTASVVCFLRECESRREGDHLSNTTRPPQREEKPGHERMYGYEGGKASVGRSDPLSLYVPSKLLCIAPPWPSCPITTILSSEKQFHLSVPSTKMVGLLGHGELVGMRHRLRQTIF